MSDEDNGSPLGTYKTVFRVNKETEGEDLQSEELSTSEELYEQTRHNDLHVFEGIIKRVETQDKALDIEALAKIPLHQSARTGDIRSMEEYLKTVPPSLVSKEVNSKDKTGITPLHYAARYNHIEVAKKLVSCGADVNAHDEEELTPLHYTARYRRERTGNSQQQLDENQNLSSEPDKVEGENQQRSQYLSKKSEDELPKYCANSENDLTMFTQSVCDFLVKNGAIINIEDRYGQTPLHYAAMRGNEIVAKELLSIPEDMLKQASLTVLKIMEAQDKQGMRPIHMACTHNQKKILRMLLEARCDIQCKDNSKLTPLHYATFEGRVDIVQSLFEAAEARGSQVTVSDLLKNEDRDHKTPLHFAVENGNHEVVKLCLQKGANINTQDNNMNYPLHLASKADDFKSVKLLVDYGAHIDVRNIEMATPLHIAAQYDHKSIVEFILKQPHTSLECRDMDGYTPLLIAAKYGHADIVHMLLKNGADYEAVEKNDKTAIYLASEEDKPDALAALLEYNSVRNMINIEDKFDNSPLNIAAMKGFLPILKMLLENGADAYSKNEEEQTAIHLAADYGRLNCVRELIKHDYSATTNEDQHSNTPLHLAALNGHSKVASFLLANGAEVSARNGSMWTPLDCAASKGFVKTARVLLKAGSPIDPVDKSQTTPLHLACQFGHKDVVKLLIQWKANVMKCDTDHDNCLDLAIDNNQSDVASEIINSDFWEDALRNVRIDPATGLRTTPMRKLIKKMPDVAKEVFSRCMTDNKEKPEDKNYTVCFKYEFLDDVYASWGEKDSIDVCSEEGSNFGEEFKLLKSAMPKPVDSIKRKNNHPLMIMVTSKREDLLAHPLVTALLRHKWNSFGRTFYYTNFFIYAVFLIFITSYIMTTTAPFKFRFFENGTLIQNPTCEQIESTRYHQNVVARIGKYVIMILSVWNILRELFQIYQTKLQYLNWENLIEWITSVCAFLLVIDFDTCQRQSGYRYDWQWSLGAVAIFLAWIELVLFLQKFPALGIYVVMFKDIVNTFTQFFIVFVLFIIAFALGFYTLLQNQTAFESVWQSLIKTTVMMIGEFEYDAIFNSQVQSSPETLVNNEPITYMLFCIFMAIMSIIIMNLLVGLAVDDIKGVQEQAALKRMAMQVDLALNVERIVPEFIRRHYAIKEQKIKPNESSWNPLKKLAAIETHYLSSATIAKALNPELDDIKKVKESQEEVQKRVRKLEQLILAHNAKIENMLSVLLKKENVPYEDEDLQDETYEHSFY